VTTAEDDRRNRAHEAVIPGVGRVRGLRRIGRGLLSWAMVPVFPLAPLLPSLASRLDDPARERDGLTIVLSGIQGASLLERQMALGLADAGVPGRIEIVDWTTGNPLRLIEHLRQRHRAAEQGIAVAERIVAYRRDRPETPVNLVGYSGGGYLALLALEALLAETRVSRSVLIAPSCSGRLDVSPLAERTENGLYLFHSPFDVLALGLLTTVAGTMDGWYEPSSGLIGFDTARRDATPDPSRSRHPSQADRYVEVAYRWRWWRSFHYGGHFGYANRVWAGEVLGPVLTAPPGAGVPTT
jgi:pimeloyl-ACP methyl ester carboxylesterase